MFNRRPEPDLFDAIGELGGRLHRVLAAGPGHADRPLSGRHSGPTRAPGRHKFLRPSQLTDDRLARVRALNEIAAARGQSLAQLALAWTLRDDRVTSTLIGASSVAQLAGQRGDRAQSQAERVGAGVDRTAHSRAGHRHLVRWLTFSCARIGS